MIMKRDGRTKRSPALRLPSPGSSGKCWVHEGVPPPPRHGTPWKLIFPEKGRLGGRVQLSMG